jgi:hypothetical protein
MLFGEKTESDNIERRLDEKADLSADVAHGIAIDPEAEKKLLWKCDLRILPPLFVLFLLAFLDRTNIGRLSHPVTSE